jgi:hypothetical protein
MVHPPYAAIITAAAGEGQPTIFSIHLNDYKMVTKRTARKHPVFKGFGAVLFKDAHGEIFL